MKKIISICIICMLFTTNIHAKHSPEKCTENINTWIYKYNNVSIPEFSENIQVKNVDATIKINNNAPSVVYKTSRFQKKLIKALQSKWFYLNKFENLLSSIYWWNSEKTISDNGTMRYSFNHSYEITLKNITDKYISEEFELDSDINYWSMWEKWSCFHPNTVNIQNDFYLPRDLQISSWNTIIPYYKKLQVLKTDSNHTGKIWAFPQKMNQYFLSNLFIWEIKLTPNEIKKITIKYKSIPSYNIYENAQISWDNPWVNYPISFEITWWKSMNTTTSYIDIGNNLWTLRQENNKYYITPTKPNLIYYWDLEIKIKKENH